MIPQEVRVTATSDIWFMAIIELQVWNGIDVEVLDAKNQIYLLPFSKN